MSKATQGLICPKCGHGNLNKAGERKIVSKKEKLKQYYCPDCGKTTRYPKGQLIMSEAENE
jgi:predicted RNA-binding Zn-ribbon protein involved in translation (DUF1610 family)